jgi:HSP20 family protein
MSRQVSRQSSRNEVSGLYDDPFQGFETRMNQFFRNMFDSGVEANIGNYPVDVDEDEESITIEAEMPGFKRDEVEVSVENGVLTIKGEREGKEGDGKRKRHMSERRYTRVQRSFSLPRSVDGSDVNATMSDGILTIRLNKTEASKPRKIEIR